MKYPLAIMALALAGTAQAQVFKCVGDNGETRFQDHPCGAEQTPMARVPAHQPSAPGVAERRYQAFIRQQDQVRAQRRAHRLEELAEGRARVNSHQQRLSKKRQAEALEQEQKCQRDLRIANKRGQYVDFTCTGSGYAARPRVQQPAPVYTVPVPTSSGR